MNNERSQEFTDIGVLQESPLSELVEAQWLDLPPIEPQDLELPLDYLQDLMQRGVITEDLSTIDIDSTLLEGPELPPFGDISREKDEPLTEKDLDFGR